MGKAKKPNKNQPKDEPLKIYGSFEDVIGMSVKGSNKKMAEMLNKTPKSKGNK